MRWEDVEKLQPFPSYNINVPWKFLEENLERYREAYGLELEPDFQRNHVWTDEQRVAYVEYCLRGGGYSRQILFNCPRWGSGERHLMTLVDGLQRLTSVRAFVRNDLPAFGYLLSEYEDRDALLLRQDLVFGVNNLIGRRAEIRWYLELNSGGTPHSPADITKAKELLSNAKAAADIRLGNRCLAILDNGLDSVAWFLIEHPEFELETSEIRRDHYAVTLRRRR